jgi:hypothetical protein
MSRKTHCKTKRATSISANRKAGRSTTSALLAAFVLVQSIAGTARATVGDDKEQEGNSTPNVAQDAPSTAQESSNVVEDAREASTMPSTGTVPRSPLPTVSTLPTPAVATEVATTAASSTGAATLLRDETGVRLRVDGRDFFVVGMNWDYVPIGQNYAYSLWQQTDEVIEAALHREMSLLRRMNVNAIRVYEGMPSKWITWVWDRFGIATVVNHTVGRYGFFIDGRWTPQVDYSDPHTRQILIDDVLRLVREQKETRGLLLWLLGNENNYGLVWASTEIEALPQGERDQVRARFLYSLMNDVAVAVKKTDPGHLVALANGDVQYLDVIAREAPAIDVFGANVYRGRSAGDLFAVVQQKLDKPVLLTEFGADAFDARRRVEDDVVQADYLLAQWQELFEQSAGKGRVQNAIGGFTFQWSDGWWKYRQTERLDVHDTTASWPNGGYAEDFVEGDNNMNEEWWGLCAKGPPDPRGLYDLRPRAAFFALKEALALEAYAPSTTLAAIQRSFAAVDVTTAAALAHGENARAVALDVSRYRLSAVRLEISTFATGGSARQRLLPGATEPTSGDGFDHTESFSMTAAASPASNVDATLTLNVLGNVASNPIDELFYEARGRLRSVTDTATATNFFLQGIERVAVHDANVVWDEDWFRLHGFFRTGHGHWGYDGDFFGLYREAFYGSTTDTYDADTPIGFEMEGKRGLQGLRLAFGPEIWWGANPAVIAKYSVPLGPVVATAMYTEQFARQNTILTSTTLPEQATRKATVSAQTRLGPMTIDAGGIWSGSTRIGQGFANVKVDDDGGYRVRQDEVLVTDAFGARAKITAEGGPVHAYVQGAYMGLVADGGPQYTTTFTGWQLRDSGLGNQANALAGVAVDVGPFQIAPNFLWQRPLVGPVPAGLAEAAPRTVLSDPFAVRGNRETLGGELLLVFDPTPATWLWAWDNDVREDAPLAASLDFSYRHQPTTQDAGFGVTADGKLFAFNGAPPPRDLWNVDARVVSRLHPRVRIVGHAYAGPGESTGNSSRFPNRYGADTRLVVDQWNIAAFARFNDWGPFTYHRDFNLTFPLQLMGDVSTTLGAVRWFDMLQTRLGVRGTWRALNGYSPRFCPNPTVVDGSGACDPLSGPAPWGSEYEVRTYLSVGL